MIIVTTGFSVSRHFCHERLINTGLFTLVPQSCHETPESCCDGKIARQCGKDMKGNDCCKNEHALIKFTEEFTVNQKYNPAVHRLVIFGMTLPDFCKGVAYAADISSGKLWIAHPPPASVDLLTLIHSFLI